LFCQLAKQALCYADFIMKLLLKLAILSGNCQAVLALLKCGGQINVPDNKGISPLMLAASKGHLDLCTLLLEHGANEYWKAPDGKTALLVAMENGHANVAQLFTQLKQNNNSYQEQEPQISCFETLLSHGEWEEEAPEASPPMQEVSLLVQATEQNLLFSRFIPAYDGEDWTDIDFELPDNQLLERSRSRLGSEYIERARMVIFQARQAGRINNLYLHDIFEDHQDKDHLVNRLCQVLMAYDIVITDDPPDYWESLFRGSVISDDLIYDSDAEQEILRDFIHAFRDDGQVLYSYFADVAYISSSKKDNVIDLLEKRDQSVWELLTLLTQFPEDVLSFVSSQLFFESTGEVNEEESSQGEELFFDDIRNLSTKYKDFYSTIKKKRSMFNEAFDAYQLFSILTDIKYDIDFIQKFALDILSVIQSTYYSFSKETMQWKNKIKFSTNDLIKCRSRIVEENLRLVLYFSKKYQHLGCELSDIIQEANIGLWRATAKFDSRRDAKFSTCAVWWIKQSLMRYIQNFFNTIRIPIHMQDGAYDRLGHDSHGWEPFLEHRTDYEEVPTWLNRNTLIEKNGRDLPLVKILFDHLPENEKDAILATHGFDNFTPEFEVIRDNMDEQIAFLLGELTEKEKDVLMLRFGIQSSHDHTLEEIGQQFGVTRERIRQIEAKALRKMRHPVRSRTLEVFWNG
jgi:RNA polymerase primary sigma factor